MSKKKLKTKSSAKAADGSSKQVLKASSITKTDNDFISLRGFVGVIPKDGTVSLEELKHRNFPEADYLRSVDVATQVEARMRKHYYLGLFFERNKLKEILTENDDQEEVVSGISEITPKFRYIMFSEFNEGLENEIVARETKVVDPADVFIYKQQIISEFFNIIEEVRKDALLLLLSSIASSRISQKNLEYLRGSLTDNDLRDLDYIATQLASSYPDEADRILQKDIIINIVSGNEAMALEKLQEKESDFQVMEQRASNFATLHGYREIVSFCISKYLKQYDSISPSIHNEVHKQAHQAIIRGDVDICKIYLQPSMWERYSDENKAKIMNLIITRSGTETRDILVDDLSKNSLVTPELTRNSCLVTIDPKEKSEVIRFLSSKEEMIIVQTIANFMDIDPNMRANILKTIIDNKSVTTDILDKAIEKCGDQNKVSLVRYLQPTYEKLSAYDKTQQNIKSERDSSIILSNTGLNRAEQYYLFAELSVRLSDVDDKYIEANLSRINKFLDKNNIIREEIEIFLDLDKDLLLKSNNFMVRIIQQNLIKEEQEERVATHKADLGLENDRLNKELGSLRAHQEEENQTRSKEKEESDRVNLENTRLKEELESIRSHQEQKESNKVKLENTRLKEELGSFRSHQKAKEKIISEEQKESNKVKLENTRLKEELESFRSHQEEDQLTNIISEEKVKSLEEDLNIARNKVKLLEKDNKDLQKQLANSTSKVETITWQDPNTGELHSKAPEEIARIQEQQQRLDYAYQQGVYNGYNQGLSDGVKHKQSYQQGYVDAQQQLQAYQQGYVDAQQQLQEYPQAMSKEQPYSNNWRQRVANDKKGYRGKEEARRNETKDTSLNK